jgi:hypothetical protein
MSQIVNTILSQLGGNRFVVMTGAKNLTSDKNCLIFKLPSRFAKDGINAVRITLDPSDTYTMTFYKQGRAPSFKVTVVAEHSDVYAEDLRRIFTDVTGLETSLGTLSAS